MSQICRDLSAAANVLIEFHNIFGPELKSVTGNPQVIEDVIQRVDRLVNIFEHVTFDAFSSKNYKEWQHLLKDFYNEVTRIEGEAKYIINASFRTLRSAQGAFEMLLRFQHIRSRDAINVQLKEKFNDVLEKFSEEINQIEFIFDSNQHNPPCSRNQPPVAGAIRWAHSLFLRIKSTVLHFQTHGDLLKTAKGQEVSAKYLQVGKKIRAFETNLHTNWTQKVADKLDTSLKQSLLVSITPTMDFEAPTPTALALLAASKNANKIVPVHVFAAGVQTFSINYDPELHELIAESKYLDLMGLPVPDAAVNVTLLEERHLVYLEDLKKMLHRYHTIVASMDEPTAQLMSNHIRDLVLVIEPGCRRLNWNSLGILDFSARCNQAINKFESVLFLVTKAAENIEEILVDFQSAVLIKKYSLLDTANPGTGYHHIVDTNVLPDVKDYCASVERMRTMAIDRLVKKYYAIGPMLSKVGVTVIGTDPNNALLHDYYHYWELRIFEALKTLVVYNFELCIGGFRSTQPIFQVDARLAPPEITLNPSHNELQQLLQRYLHQIVDCTKNFPRWMHNTCEITPPIQVEGQDDPVIFSFHDDISISPDVVEVLAQAEALMTNMMNKVQSYLQKWKRYRNLWKLDRELAVQKFAVKDPSCIAYDEKLQFYQNLAQEVKAQNTTQDIMFVQLNLVPLQTAVMDMSSSWLQRLGQALKEASFAAAGALKGEIEKLQQELKREPDTLESLKLILRTITDIRDNNLNMELRYRALQESIRTLHLYTAVSLTPEELTTGERVQELWELLVKESHEVDNNLITVKRKFTEITNKQVLTFSDTTKEFSISFSENGPMTVGDDLDVGLVRLQEFEKQYADLEVKRLELVDAQQLFDMSITSYAELSDIKSKLASLRLIYNLYAAQRAAREEWSQTLWSNLNVAVLEQGIDEFAGKVRQFPKEIKQLGLCRTLEAKIKEFKDSIPLFQDLKNDALRDRHWKQLMQVTGKTFDMNPQTFTLANIFEMELHKFAEKIADITTCASKELSIERGLSEVRDIWRTTGSILTFLYLIIFSSLPALQSSQLSSI